MSAAAFVRRAGLMADEVVPSSSIKWKPPAENTIDFKLQLRFPPLRASDAPDLEAKPEFLLYAWMGDNRQRDGDEQFYDRMVVLDEEWEE